MKTFFKCSFLLPFFALTLLTFSAIGQDRPAMIDVFTPAVPTGPTTTIEFEEATHDFGTIKEGEIVTHVFTFTNTGDEVLILTNAKGSCGCTVPQWPKDPIAPGETASITVKFNSKNKKGKRNQKVTISANTDPIQSFLYLKGEVELRDGEEAIPETIAKLSSDCVAIYPNPTAEILKLDMQPETIGQTAVISIFSQTGALMAQKEIESIEGTIEFNVNHYPAGTYYAKIQIGEQQLPARCFLVNR